MKYNAYQVSETPEGYRGKIVSLEATTPPSGQVMIRVHYSSLNYKDFLSATGNKGVTRKYPHVPGIDAAGVVVGSGSPEFKSGDRVVVTGYDLGMNTPGGFGEIITVPAEWIVPQPEGLTLEETMIYGTAGFTAAQCVEAILESSKTNLVDLKSAPIAVTGSGGGVGSMVVSILSHLGYEVVSLTRNPEDAFIQQLPGKPQSLSQWQGGLDRKPLLPPQWSSAVDSVGGTVLADLVRTCHYRGAVACCGMVAGIEFTTSVFPFILRGVRLIGIDSAECPLSLKKKIWEKLSGAWKPSLHDLKSVITLENLDNTLKQMQGGGSPGKGSSQAPSINQLQYEVNMNQQVNNGLEILALTRKKFLAITETMSLEQLNIIPTGFRNNLIWNIIHSPVSTDILVYGPCGLSIPLAPWVDAYRKDTRPDPQSPVTAETLSEVKKQLLVSYDRLVKDYQEGVFKGYQPYKTQFGVTLSDVEYAILYAIDHEMLHLGYAMALKRLVGEKA